jgi:hypothetical protein
MAIGRALLIAQSNGANPKSRAHLSIRPDGGNAVKP